MCFVLVLLLYPPVLICAVFWTSFVCCPHHGVPDRRHSCRPVPLIVVVCDNDVPPLCGEEQPPRGTAHATQQPQHQHQHEFVVFSSWQVCGTFELQSTKCVTKVRMRMRMTKQMYDRRGWGMGPPPGPGEEVPWAPPPGVGGIPLRLTWPRWRWRPPAPGSLGLWGRGFLDSKNEDVQTKRRANSEPLPYI